MVKSSVLASKAFFVKDKISSDKITIKQYVDTDSMLENKLGVVTASSLPPKKCNLSKFRKGDILIANIRPYLKKIWFSDMDGGCSSDVLVIRAKDGIEPKFLYYALFRDDFFNHAMKGSTGTKMPRGDKAHILEFLIPEFNKKTAEVIAEVLCIFDEKIGLNDKINTELEAMAKLIYDYWFVQFDFPDVNGKPYKSSGGKMVYSKALKREIPDEWEDKELSEVANITMGQSPSGSSYNERGKGAVFFQGSTDFGYRFPTVRQYTTEPSRLAKLGDILLSVRAPVGTLNIADGDCCIGRGLAALNSKNSADSFLFYVMLYFKQTFDRRNTSGTTFGSITKDDLFSLKLVYPSLDILREYDKKVSTYNLKIFNNHKQNKELIRLRDWLLPMLMNGQVTVKDVS
jgi:type I restriction enzyme S subunit